jgi:hypothetical protein
MDVPGTEKIVVANSQEDQFLDLAGLATTDKVA